MRLDRGAPHVLALDAAWPAAGGAEARGAPGGRVYLAAEVRLRRRTVWIAAGDLLLPGR